MFKLISKPEEVPVGRPVSLKVRYVHEGRSLDQGASIRIGYNFNDGAGVCQTDHPREPNYLAVKTEADVKLEVVNAKRRRSITFYPGTGMCDLYVFEVNIISGILNCGDTIDIILGNPECPQGGFILGKCCDNPLEFFYHIDPDNRYPLGSHQPNALEYLEYLSADGKNYPEWKSCGIKVPLAAGEPTLADISLPSTVVAGQENQLRVVVYDSFFNHLRNYEDKIELLSADNPGVQFRSISFSTGAEGYALLPIMFKQSLPPTSLRFRIPNLGLFQSNPVHVTPEVKRNRIFWGELHGHSCLSDGGCRGTDDFFNYARDIRGLDFAALADHSFGLAVKGHWNRLLKAVKEHSADGQFMALLGCEIMTNGFGHRNIYFPEFAGKLLMADYQPGSGGSFAGENIKAYQQIWDPEIPRTLAIEETIATLRGIEFLWTAHHCGRIAEDERNLLTLYEVSSEWGVSDDVPNTNLSTTKVSEIFAQRMSPGLSGGSDDHRAKAGFMGKAITEGPVRYPSGLTAVLCPDLTRQQIYNALKNKLCYATTGARILLDIDVKRNGTHLRVNLGIAGTDFLDRAWVFKNGSEIYHMFFDTGSRGKLYWEDRNFTEKDNCCIRIRQMDGQMAWINPIPFADTAADNKISDIEAKKGVKILI